MTLTDAFEFYLHGHLGKKDTQREKPHTLLSVFTNHIQPFFGQHHVQEIDEDSLKSFFKDISKTKTPSIHNKCVKVIKAVFNYCKKNHSQFYATTNPAAKIKLVEENERTRIITDQERQQLIDACDDIKHPIYTDMFKMMIFTGARAGAVESMRWDDINFETKYWLADSRANADTDSYPHKLSDESIALLTKRASTNKKKSIYVFPGRSIKNHASPGDEIWKKVITIAQLFSDDPEQRVRRQDLRRTYTVNELNATNSIESTAQQVGHNHPKNLHKATKKLAK